MKTLSLVELSRGQWARVDAEDYRAVSGYSWCVMAASTGKCYASRAMRIAPQLGRRKRPGDGKTHTLVLMHRVILRRKLGRSLAAHERVDHVNGDPSDNRRKNLRLATSSQNICNAEKYRRSRWNSRCTSQYKGVSWSNTEQRWRAFISKDGRRITIGRFSSEEDAAKAYDGAALRLHGSFARVNDVGWRR